MEALIEKHPSIAKWVEEVIIKLCPVVDSRIDLCGKSNTPEIDINISCDENTSSIYFMYGSSNVKESTIEKAQINGFISINEITDIIDFILKDHESIGHIEFKKSNAYRKEGTNEIKMIFRINWKEEAIKGLFVGDITLNLNLGRNNKIANDFAIVILNRYKKLLEHTPSFQNMKEIYLSKLKEDYFASLNKDELLAFISGLSEDDVRNLLINMPSESFEKIFINQDENLNR